MRRSLLLLCFLALCLGPYAQTYFYANAIDIDPMQPTENDNITLTISGDLSSGGSFIESQSVSVDGLDVSITVNAASEGGITVLIPHSVDLEVGMLPAGEYSIQLMGQSFGDFVSDPDDYTFVVTGDTSCPGDITGDSVVDVNDFISLNSTYGDPCDGCAEDLTGDGVVDVEDFLLMNSFFGIICQ